MRVLIALTFLCLQSVSGAAEAQVPAPQWSFVRNQMKLAKFSDAFIQEMAKSYETKDFEEVIRLNVLLFLKKSDYHGTQITDAAVNETVAFAKENKDILARAEKQFGVSSKVVASLLYIESRFGKNAGQFHVPSVYLHLVQSPRKDVQAYLLTQTARYTDAITEAQKKEVVNRTRKKAKFALQELHALERVFKWKWKLGSDFRGSFSGAFGMPQFLPSSYISYSRAAAPKTQPDLSQANDAVMSVAFYLRQHGWRARDSKSHLKALLGYNNSTDYANAILSLSEKL